jgi:DnaJ family protein B protein 4
LHLSRCRCRRRRRGADKNPGDRDGAEAKFKEVAEAYEVLNDPSKRQQYDQLGHEGLDGRGSGDGGGPAFAKVDAHELFAQFFRGFGKGGAFGASFRGGDPFGDFIGGRQAGQAGPFFARAQAQAQAQVPRVVQVDLPVSLEELYSGTVKRMKVRRSVLQPSSPQEEKAGEGGLKRSTTSVVLEVNVRPGWRTSTRITFKGAGDELCPGEFQDIMFVLVEKKHERFTREGANLVMRHAVPLVDALTGFELKVPLLDGSVLHQRVEGVVKPGSSFVLHGKGMPHARRPADMGDLVVLMDVVFPDALDDKQKKALRATL